MTSPGARYSAGTAFLDIIPSFRGVQNAIRREVQQMERALGKEAGDEFGKQFGDSATKAVDKALGTTKASARKSGREAAEEYAGLFERTVRGRIQAALSNFPQIKFDADVSPAEDKLMKLRQRMIELDDKRIGVDIDGSAALAELENIRRQLAELANNENVDVRVRTDAAGAATELLAVRALMELVDRTDVNVEVDVDTGAAVGKLAALHAALMRTAGGGENGANSFRAFNAVVLAGATLLPAVVPAVLGLAGGLALVAPMALGAASGFGVLGIAFSGIGDAVSALGKVQDDTAKDSEAAAKRIATASRTVEDAQRALQRAEESGARQVASANRAVSEAREDAARVAEQAAERVADAIEQQEDAEQDLVRAQEDVVRAQQRVNEAREEAKDRIEDLRFSIIGGALAEREAVLDLAEAQREYEASLVDPEASAEDRERLLIDLEQQRLRVQQLGVENGRLAEEQAEVTRTGVEGSREVAAAQDGVRAAQERVADAQERVQDAIVGVAQAVADGQRAQADASQRIADAVAAQSQAQADAARAVEDAQLNLAQAQEDYTRAIGETSSSVEALEVAMGKLGPAGREFAEFWFALTPQFREIRDIVQAGIFPGLQAAITDILTVNGPMLTAFMGNMAETLGNMFRQFGDMMTSPQWLGIWRTFSEYAPIFMDQFGRVGMAMLTFFGELFQGLAPYSERFGEALVVLAEESARWMAAFTESPAFREIMEWLFTNGPVIFEHLWSIARAGAALLEALAPLGLVILDLVGNIADFIAEMDPDVLGVIVSTILGLVVAFQLATGAASLVAGAAAIIGSGFATVIFIIAMVVTGLITLYTQSETFRDIVDAAFRAVGEVIDFVWNKVIKPVLDSFSWLIDEIQVALDNFTWSGFVDGLTGTLEDINNWFNELPGNVWEFVKPGGTLDQQFIGMWDGITNDLESGNEGTKAFEIGQWFRNLGEDVWEYVKPGGIIDQNFVDMWDGITGNLEGDGEDSIGGKIGTWFRDTGSDIWEIIKPGGEWDQNFIGMWDGIVDELNGEGDEAIAYKIGHWFGNLSRTVWDYVKPGGTLDQQFVGMWNGLTRDLEEGNPNDPGVKIGQWFRRTGENMWEYLKPGGTLDQSFVGMWNGITDELDELMPKVGNWFAELPGNIWDFLSKENALDRLGQDIISGIWNGITTKWFEFTAWLDEKWEEFKQGFKDAFGIESPSKVFEQFGRWLIEGLLNGINSLFQDVIDRFTKIKEEAVAKFTEMRDRVTGLAGEARDWVGERFTDMRDSITGLAGEARDWVSERFTNMRDNITGFAGEARDWVSERFTNMRDNITGSATDAREWVSERFTNMRDNVTTSAGEARDWVSERFGSMRDNAVEFGTDLRDRVSGVAGEARDWVVETFTDMRDTVTGLFEDLVSGVARVWDGIKNATAKPINFVIKYVLNEGLFKAFNLIIDTLNLDKEWKLGPLDQVGDPAARLAAGGKVPGYSPNDKADNIPAMLTAGEWVQPVSTVNYYGADVMEAIRKRRIPREAFQYLAEGGAVYQQIFASVKKKFPRAKMNSGLRRGDSGLHGAGLAVDLGEEGFSGGRGRPYLAAMNQALYDTAKPFVAELIYDGAGDNRADIKDGKDLRYSAATIADHFDHVHLGVRAAQLAGFLAAFGKGDVIAGGESIWSSITDAFNSLKDSVTEPLRGLGELVGDSTFGKILGAMPGKAVDWAWGKVKGFVGDFINMFDQSNGGDNAAVDAVIRGGQVQDVVKSVAARYGWDRGAEWDALNQLIQKESGWNPKAQNPTSTAYGLFQFLNSTWAGTGVPKTGDPAGQAQAGLRYIMDRYGSPSRAWAFHRQNNWYSEGGEVAQQGAEAPTLYDTGGWLPPGITTVLNATNKPEPILTGQQWDELVAARSDAQSSAPYIGEINLPIMTQATPESISGEIMHTVTVAARGGKKF